MPEIVAWPDSWYKAASSRFYLSSASQASQSPWSGRRSVYGPHRQFWRCEIQIVPQEAAMWKAMSAFFSEAGGQHGLIRIGDFTRRQPQYNLEAVLTQQAWSDDTFFSDGTGWLEGAVPPTVHVRDAAARGANTLVLGGFMDDISGVLRRGDLFEIRRDGVAEETPSLHVVLRQASSDANGETGILFAPALRKGVAAGDMVVLEKPTSVFRCVDDEQGIVDVAPPSIGVLGFTLIENII